MSEHDELREKLRHLTSDPGSLGSAVCALLKAAAAGFPVMVMPDESRAILDLLAAVREAPPISDTEVARIIEAVEAHCGMGHGAWDMVAARDLVEGFAAALGAPAPAEATEPSAPEGATWGDVRSGLRAELIAEGMPITEATRIARKVVHRFSAAEATERSESEPPGPYRLTGAAIRNRRTAAGMSLRELAAAVGISNVEMGEIERGIRRPDEKTVTAIRNAIDAARCGLPSPVRGYGPCILRRGHSGPGAHQHGETGRIMQAYHAPDTSEEGAGDAE